MTSPADPTGLLLVDKPAGVTSHDVVGRARAVLGTRRVGHAGTLDPMATGLLVLGVGRATKLLGYLALADKTYTATLRFGQASTTDDADGELMDGADATALSTAAIETTLAGLTGAIEQVPSTYSAIKINGARAHARARAGEEVALAPRPVTVTRFERTAVPRPDPAVGPGVLDVDAIVDCSTGTYVRALARDAGRALGVGGHLTALRRTRIGPFAVADAIDLFPDGVTGPDGRRPAIAPELRAATARALRGVDDVISEVFDLRHLTDREATDLAHGRPLAAQGRTGVHAAVTSDGRLIGLVEERDGASRPVFVYRPAAG